MCFVHKHMQNADFGQILCRRASTKRHVTSRPMVRFSQTWYQKMRKTWKKKVMKRRVAICGGREAVADFVQGGVKLTPPPVKIGLSHPLILKLNALHTRHSRPWKARVTSASQTAGRLEWNVWWKSLASWGSVLDIWRVIKENSSVKRHIQYIDLNLIPLFVWFISSRTSCLHIRCYSGLLASCHLHTQPRALENKVRKHLLKPKSSFGK